MDAVTDDVEEDYSARDLAEGLASGDASILELPASTLAAPVIRLGSEDRKSLLERVDPETAAQLLEHCPFEQSVESLGELDPEVASKILEELPSDWQVDFITELSPELSEPILEQLSPEITDRIRSLSVYESDTAGGLMSTEVLSYHQRTRVSELIEDLRQHAGEYRDYEVQYIYVTGSRRQLAGVIRLRDLLLTHGDPRLDELNVIEPIAVPVTKSLEDLKAFFDDYSFLGVPVVDERNRLLGIVHRRAVSEALAEQNESDFLKAQGIVGGEELRTMKLSLRSKRRLSWLSVNILLNVVAASVIALFQDTLAQAISLAVFLPIISDMSGCSGNQAVAVSMRELTLGLVNARDVGWVLVREVVLGLVNGLVLGVLIAGVAFVWKGNPYLGLVVGLAMLANTVIAVSLGGTIPLVLKRLGRDPALASGPILTTVTDLCGFLLVLGLASVMIERIA